MSAGVGVTSSSTTKKNEQTNKKEKNERTHEKGNHFDIFKEESINGEKMTHDKMERESFSSDSIIE